MFKEARKDHRSARLLSLLNVSRYANRRPLFGVRNFRSRSWDVSLQDLLLNVSNKLSCYESAAANIQDQQQVQGFNSVADRSVAPHEPTPMPVGDSTSFAYQPAVTQEPKPVSVENPTPPTQPPSVVEIDQQAIAAHLFHRIVRLINHHIGRAIGAGQGVYNGQGEGY